MCEAGNGPNLRLSDDARVLLKSQVIEYTNEYFEKESRRVRGWAWFFAGLNLIGLAGLIGSVFYAAYWFVEKRAEQVVNSSQIVQAQVGALASATVDATKKVAKTQLEVDQALSDAQTKTGEAIAAANRTIVQAEENRRVAARTLVRFKAAAEQAGDPELLEKFMRLKELSDRLDDSKVDVLQETLRKDAADFVAERVASVLPIGTILAWHKNSGEVPLTLPDG